MYKVAVSHAIEHCAVMCVWSFHIPLLSHTVVTIGLVPDPTAGTPDYEITENTSSFQFCAQIINFAIPDPDTIITVNLTTQPVGAQGLCNNFDTNTHLYHKGDMIGSLLIASQL